MRKKIVKNKKYFLFVIAVLVIGIISGFIYSALLGDSIKMDIINTIKSQDSFNNNFILKDLIIMAILLVSSFIIVGIPLSIVYIYYEGFSVGFLLTSFFLSYKLNGILYISIYLVVNKLLVFLLMLIFIKRIINISRFIIGFIIYRKDNLIKEKIINNSFKASYVIFFVFIINILIYFLSPLILNMLKFLLK